MLNISQLIIKTGKFEILNFDQIDHFFCWEQDRS